MAARRRLRPCRHPCLFRHACAGARRRFRRPVAGTGRGARPDHRDPRRSFGAKRGGLLVRVRLCDRRSGPVCAGAALRKIAATRGGDRDRLCGVGVDRGAGARPRTAGRGAHQAASHWLDPHRHAAGGRSHRASLRGDRRGASHFSPATPRSLLPSAARRRAAPQCPFLGRGILRVFRAGGDVVGAHGRRPARVQLSHHPRRVGRPVCGGPAMAAPPRMGARGRAHGGRPLCLLDVGLPDRSSDRHRVRGGDRAGGSRPFGAEADHASGSAVRLRRGGARRIAARGVPGHGPAVARCAGGYRASSPDRVSQLGRALHAQ